MHQQLNRTCKKKKNTDSTATSQNFLARNSGDRAMCVLTNSLEVTVQHKETWKPHMCMVLMSLYPAQNPEESPSSSHTHGCIQTLLTGGGEELWGEELMKTMSTFYSSMKFSKI